MLAEEHSYSLATLVSLLPKWWPLIMQKCRAFTPHGFELWASSSCFSKAVNTWWGVAWPWNHPGTVGLHKGDFYIETSRPVFPSSTLTHSDYHGCKR